MNSPVIKTLLAASTLVLLTLQVSACKTEYQGGINQPATEETEASPGAEVEPQCSTPTPEGDIGDVNQATEVESGQAEAPSGAPKEVSGEHPENTPSLEERNAILDRVNRGAPLHRSGSKEEIGEGPEPGTESNIGQ